MADVSPTGPLQVLATLDRFAAATPSRPESDRDTGPTRGVAVGAILHTAWGQSGAREFADRNREILTRAIAVLIHDTISDPSVYPGAARFLATSTTPEQWDTPADVDAWLTALHEAAVTVPEAPSSPVSRLLDERAEQLGTDEPATTDAEPLGHAQLRR